MKINPLHIIAAASMIGLALVVLSYFEILEQSSKINNRPSVIIDSMRVIISQKDSVIADKQKVYNEGKMADSANLYNINKSIKNVYYEIKKQSNHTYSVSDSLFGSYVDSIRSAKGFSKIQY